ncbi:AIM24 family protein [Segnochrobactrum spirostomi]|uniref:AIM24 family protein n=1 Tax=Segnochrobactrum spirostomi TaxID=2608987 RepID=A0A6A7Y326_9HYPH|nr:AIM24 family protein [Segnochrobactrum spirostomi]MQT12777.1 AIM24 family protein [Segnochrobactrum spirostomi]
MHAEIVGTTLPVLEIRLDPGDDLVAEPAQLSWMRGPVRLNTKMMTAGAGGILGVFGRALAGGGLFMTEFTVEGGPGEVAFAARVPGTIHAVGVEPGHGMLIHRNGFLCATGGVELGIGFQQSLGAGIFGGNGFVLQRLTGRCTAWVELGGETVVKDLAPGEQIFVHPGHVGMFEERVGFEITTVPGVRNMLFGGDGLFLAVLTGPGRVWLQTLTLPGLAHALAPYFPQPPR